jgi:hypothetical protein
MACSDFPGGEQGSGLVQVDCLRNEKKSVTSELRSGARFGFPRVSLLALAWRRYFSRRVRIWNIAVPTPAAGALRERADDVHRISVGPVLQIATGATSQKIAKRKAQQG